MHHRNAPSPTEAFLSAPLGEKKRACNDLVVHLRAALAEGRRAEVLDDLRAAAGSRLDYTSAMSFLRVLRSACRSGPAPGREVRVAVLGGFTTAQLKDLLELELFAFGLGPRIYESGYGQFRQEILDPDSGLSAFRPDIVYLATSWRDLSRRPSLGDSPDSVRRQVEREVADWSLLWERVHRSLGAQVIQDNFAPPPWRVLGNHEQSWPAAFVSYVGEVNRALREAAPAHVTVHDVDHLAASVGRWAWSDQRFFHQAKLPCSPEHLVDYAHSVASVVAAQFGLARKCLVLDLDNTLWGGVVGDDGLEGIRVGQGDPESEAFQDFQRYVKSLRDRGVILAVCSANQESIAKEVFERHPAMVLTLDDVSCFVADWNDKATNLRRIAAELDIGTDALVFVDDDPFQRSLVRRMLPEVAVPEMPEDSADYIQVLDSHRYFQTVSVGEEDLRRTEAYRSNSKRRDFHDSSGDLESFLEGLEMTARVEPVSPANAGRAAQLVNKTNQFNLTLRRPKLPKVLSIIDDSEWITLTATLNDRFGDNGLVSVLLARIDGQVLDVDVWVMSCRVLRRGVEFFLMNRLHELALERGIPTIRGTFVPGPKNALVESLFGTLGFSHVEKGPDGFETWELPVSAARTPLLTFVRAEEVAHG